MLQNFGTNVGSEEDMPHVASKLSHSLGVLGEGLGVEEGECGTGIIHLTTPLRTFLLLCIEEGVTTTGRSVGSGMAPIFFEIAHTVDALLFTV